jgi:predicted XRE-type DNA-binding protein
MKRIELDAVGLREEAERAIEASSRTQADVARELDVTRASVNQALRSAAPRYEKLRCRIVELLTSYEVEKNVTYLLRPKGE